MFQTIFNLYAASVFSEHPLALWPIDDDFGYVSLIDANPQWVASGGSLLYSGSAQYIPVDKPSETVGVADALVDYSSDIQTFAASATMTLKTQSFNNLAKIDSSKPTVSVSAYVYEYSDIILNCKIGFEYIDPITSTTERSYTTYTAFSSDSWEKIDHVFTLGEKSWATTESVNIFPFLEISFKNGNKVFSLYNFSVGQWSEEYNDESAGVIPVPITSTSASAGLVTSLGINSASAATIKVIETDPYNLSNQDIGYYIIQKNKMLATNSKLPMVFGSRNITEIYTSPVGNIPSMIFPGKGFFHEYGRYRDLTAEFWLRIDVKSNEKIKIFGPLTTEDGLYVHESFITLRLGPYEKSYFIGKWYRPMLIDITYSSATTTVMINGDTVISIDLNQDDLDLPSISPAASSDWVGFYGNDNASPYQIDCFAIYPYIVAGQLAKKRFVYGQAVGKSDDIVRNFNGDLTNIDFSFAKYTSDMVYPDMTKWSAGFASNINANSRYLALPDYQLPEILYYGSDLSIFNLNRLLRTWGGIGGNADANDSAYFWSRWTSGIWNALAVSREANVLYDNYFVQSDLTSQAYISLRPSSLYNSLYGYIGFQSINVINELVNSIFGVFSLSQNELDNYILAEGITTSNYQNKELTLMHFINSSTNDVFKIYIDLQNNGGTITANNLIYQYNSDVLSSQPFGSINDDQYFVAGVFLEKINKYYSSILRNFFANRQNIKLNVGGYQNSMFPGKIYKVTFNNKFFTNKDLKNNIATNGTFTSNNSHLISESSSLVDYIGNYTLLFKRTNNMLIMDIGCAGYWEDSLPLSYFGSTIKNAEGENTVYDLDLLQFNIDYPSSIVTTEDLNNAINADNLVSYITLQSKEDVGNINYSQYVATKELTTNRVVDFETAGIDPDVTKFKIIDGTVVFPPKSIISFDDAYVTFHLELKTDGINTNPVQLHRMSMSSLAFDQSTLYPINTTTGNKIYPFVKNGAAYSTKIKNPFLMYKDSMPYLYLTGDSGISAIAYDEIDSGSISRGISIPINPNKYSSYDLHGFHIWICYNKSKLIGSTQNIMSVITSDNKYNIFIEPEYQNKRGYLKAYYGKQSRQTPYSNAVFYQNGVLMNRPYLRPSIWSLMTVVFKEPLSFDNFIGQLEINPGVVFNNIAFFNQDIERSVDDIFESHLGLSHIVASDQTTLSLDNKDLLVYSDIEFTTFSGKLV